MWRSWLAHHVRDVGVGCSSHLIPTKGSLPKRTFFYLYNSQLLTGSGAVGSALRSGRRGRVFESPLPDKKGLIVKIGPFFVFYLLTSHLIKIVLCITYYYY